MGELVRWVAAASAVGLLTLAGLFPSPPLPDGAFAPEEPAPASAQPSTDAAHASSIVDPDAGQPVYANASAVMSHCLTDAAGQLTCQERELARLMRAAGQPAAFAVLASMSQTSTDVAREEHNIAHSLGRAALAWRGNVTAALADCPFTMAAGCFHGVLEDYLATRQNVSAADVGAMCPASAGGAQSSRQFQCLHGLGHGLDMYSGHDWQQGLQLCDLLDGAWSRDSCYGGVFMENIVGDDDALRGGSMPGMADMPGMDHMHAATPRPDALPRFNASAALYPCDRLGARYLSACYLMVSAMMMHMHPEDYDYAFTACAAAPSSYQWLCFQSVGRDISGNTLRDPAASIAACERPSDPRKTDCMVGVVRDYINTAGELAPGIAFCAQLNATYADACWTATGQMAASLGIPVSERLAECRPAAGTHANQCAGASIL